jgi:DMSO reductase anchor subunit
MIQYIILLGYLGIAISVAFTLGKYFTGAYKKEFTPSSQEIEAVTRMKNRLKFLYLAVFISGAFGLCGIWYLEKQFPVMIAHLLILAGGYLVIGYIDILLKGTLYTLVEKSKLISAAESRIQTVKRIWYINAGVISVFCIVYTQVNPYPFYGIWGIIAGALTLVASYPPVLLAKELLSEVYDTSMYKEDWLYILSICFSWIIGFWALHLGSP